MRHFKQKGQEGMTSCMLQLWNIGADGIVLESLRCQKWPQPPLGQRLDAMPQVWVSA